MNNCIGYKNHRYFVLFLFYLWFATIYLGIALTGVMFGYISCDNQIYYSWQHILTFINVLCISVAVTMTGFFGWHFYLIITNQTTIEFQFNKISAWTSRTTPRINEFDLGWRKNLEQIFGRVPLWRMLLPSLSELPLDGANFPSLESGEQIV